jgi:glycosyltransferase involved in cell wall biosynthesis
MVPYKICFLSSMHPPKDKRVFDKEAVSLVQAGFAVSHLCPGKLGDSGVDCGVRIRTYIRPAGIKGRVMQLMMLYRLARDEDADVYHCNEVDSWGVGVALRLFRGKRCVFDVHEHYPSTFAQSRFPTWLQPAVAGAVRLVFCVFTPFTERIVLAKRSVADDFHTDPAKKVLVQNYTPLSGLNFAAAAHGHVVKEHYTLVHLGLFSKIRGWPQVLHAMSLMQHQNLRLLVIGEINDGSRDEFLKQVQLLGLADRVSQLDWMPFDQAFAHLLQADIGLIAFQPGVQNHVYAMPHKMFDYMAAGLAVMLPAFAVEVAPVVQESRCGVLIDSGDPQDIAAKLDALLTDPAEMRAMGQRGRQAVKQQYNWEAEATSLVSMYKEMEQLK